MIKPSKPLLVLIPGVMNNDMLWQHQIVAFAEEWQIWVPETHHYPTIREASTAIMEQACHKTEAPFALAGLSMGGYIAIDMVRIAPSYISHLALMNTTMRSDDALQKKARRAFIKQSYIPGFKGVTPRLLPHIIDKSLLEVSAVTEVVYAMASSFSGSDFRMQQKAILSREDQRAFAASIRCPTLIISGEHDKVTPPILQEEMHDLVPDSSWKVIEHCGHLSALERPSIVNAQMSEWLARPATACN